MALGGQFDQLLDALGHRYRRRLLVALIEHNPQDDDDPQEAEEALTTAIDGVYEADSAEMELAHIHLPKLEEYGYITWHRSTGKIVRGPNWEEIAPLLQLLQDRADELPEDWL